MSALDLPDPWTPIEAGAAHVFEQELKHELCPTHPLAGVSVECLARRGDRDDFLFRLDGHRSEFAIVHLTWHQETQPDWPWTTFFASADDLVANWRRIFE